MGTDLNNLEPFSQLQILTELRLERLDIIIGSKKLIMKFPHI